MSLDIYLRAPRIATVFEANITHNLNAMADEASLYCALWRPEEVSIEKASELIEPLELGIAAMKREPERFKRHNPENGWGSYDTFLPWLEKLLEACKENPDATIEVNR